MYMTDRVIHFRLEELEMICSLVSLFDKKTADRIDDCYSYHKNILHESVKQPLQLTLDEIHDYLLRVHYKTVLQPEFIFSDDEEIF